MSNLFENDIERWTTNISCILLFIIIDKHCHGRTHLTPLRLKYFQINLGVSLTITKEKIQTETHFSARLIETRNFRVKVQKWAGRMHWFVDLFNFCRVIDFDFDWNVWFDFGFDWNAIVQQFFLNSFEFQLLWVPFLSFDFKIIVHRNMLQNSGITIKCLKNSFENVFKYSIVSNIPFMTLWPSTCYASFVLFAVHFPIFFCCVRLISNNK